MSIVEKMEAASGFVKIVMPAGRWMMSDIPGEFMKAAINLANQLLDRGIGDEDRYATIIARALMAADEAATKRAALQPRVAPWMLACFGEEISADKVERRHRFTEEALELLQAMDGTRDEALQLVDYVFGRPKGDPHQEVGGVMITLAALCLAADMDMHQAGEDELARIWTKVEKIRAKQAAKPKFSVLPVATLKGEA